MCPKCGEEFKPPIRKGPAVKKNKAPEVQKNVQHNDNEGEIIDVEDLEEIDADVGDDEELIEDASDLGENDHEMPEVASHNDMDDMENKI